MKYLGILFLLLISAVTMADASGYFPHPGLRLTVDTDTVFKKRSIAAGVSYGSDAQFFGRTGPITYPYMSTDVIFNTKNGFFVYGSVLKLLGYPTLADEVDLGGGYLYRFSKQATGSISYIRSIFNKDQRVIESSSSNDVNYKNAYDFKLVQSSVILDYLFGKSDDFFITMKVSKYIEPSWSVFDDKDYLTFNPALSIILGTQNFVETYTLDHNDRFAADNIIINGPAENTRPYNNGRFNALNYSFKIPVAYNRPHYTFEASYKYSIPVNVQGSLMNKREAFYGLAFIYVFY